MVLSKKAIELLKKLFADDSGLQVQVGLIDVVAEIKTWIKNQESDPGDSK